MRFPNDVDSVKRCHERKRDRCNQQQNLEPVPLIHADGKNGSVLDSSGSITERPDPDHIQPPKERERHAHEKTHKQTCVKPSSVFEAQKPKGAYSQDQQERADVESRRLLLAEQIERLDHTHCGQCHQGVGKLPHSHSSHLLCDTVNTTPRNDIYND